jgi:hypothetical protein
MSICYSCNTSREVSINPTSIVEYCGTCKVKTTHRGNTNKQYLSTEFLADNESKLSDSELYINECHECRTKTSYVYKDHKLFYRSGCLCDNSYNLEEVAWEHFIIFYNYQKSPRSIMNLNNFLKGNISQF